jgi:hypothetical protein
MGLTTTPLRLLLPVTSLSLGSLLLLGNVSVHLHMRLQCDIMIHLVIFIEPDFEKPGCNYFS